LAAAINAFATAGGGEVDGLDLTMLDPRRGRAVSPQPLRRGPPPVKASICSRNAVLLADAMPQAAVADIVPHGPDVEAQLRGHLLNRIEVFAATICQYYLTSH
jgi:hypothetical protein